MSAALQAQHFGDIRVDGQGNQLVINQIIQIAVAEIRSRPFVSTSPYIGLARFEERHKDFFFGRDALIAKLLGMIAAKNLLLVTGASGSGKSSLVRSGLLPQLAGRLPQGRFRPIIVTPDRDPFLSLRGALLGIGMSQSQTAEVRSDSDVPLAPLLQSLRPPEEQWLFFLDQFEEIFTLCRDSRARSRFLDGLVDLGRGPTSYCKVVVAMRADFFDRLGGYPELAGLAETGLCLVSDMLSSELRAAIEQPAARHGVVFEEGLVEQIIADVRGRPGTLPLLQYTLDLLWHKDQPVDDRTLNTVNYHLLGGVEGALRQRADALFGFADKAQQRPRPDSEKRAMRRIFLRLVDLTGQGAKALAISKRSRHSEFEQEEELRLISELVDEKLLVSNAAVGRAAAPSTVELTHEALLSAWPLLTDWIAQARETLYIRNRLTADASRWAVEVSKDADKAVEDLWNGSRLAQAQELRDRGEFSLVLGGLTAEESAFLTASLTWRDHRIHEEHEQRDRLARKELEKQQQRTRYLRIGVTLLSAFSILAGGITYYALGQRTDALRQKHAAEQREMDVVIEEGRQLLIQRDLPLEAALWFQHAYVHGSESPTLPYLMGEAVRSQEATRHIMLAAANANPKIATFSDASFSPDGTFLLTTGGGHSARVWDVKSGKPVLTLDGTESVANVRFSPDGQRLLTASQEHGVRVWDVKSGKPVLTLDDTQNFPFARFSPDGQRIVITSYEKSAQLRDAQTGKPLHILNDFIAYEASFSPDGNRLVTTSTDNAARIWDAQTGRFLYSIDHPSPVQTARFSPDGGRLVTKTEDKTARIWDVPTGELLFTAEDAPSAVNPNSFSPDGRRIVLAHLGRNAELWDVQTGKIVKAGNIIFKWSSGNIHSAEFSPDGTRLLLAYKDRIIQVVDARNADLLESLYGHGADVTRASFSPDERHIVSLSKDRTLRIWDAAPRAPIFTLRGHAGTISAASFSPDGTRLVTAGGQDETIRIWDAQTGKPLYTIRAHSGTIFGAVYSPDGTRIATAGEDNAARIWDAQTGKLLYTLKAHTNAVRSIAYSRDGSLLVTASRDHTAAVWDAQSGKLLRICQHNQPVNYATFSPDGTQIATASDDKIARIWNWDAMSDRLQRELPGHTDVVWSVGFSSDGTRLLTASSDATARIWEASTGKPLLTIRHSSALWDASFSPDGQRIAAASPDGTARLFGVQAGRLLSILDGHSNQVWSARFSADGNRLVTASLDGTASIWSVGAEPRNANELAKLLRCRVPLRLDNATVASAALESQGCEDLPQPPPPPLRWDQRTATLQIAIYALHAGDPTAARIALKDARTRLNDTQDGLALARLELAEASLTAPATAPFPEAAAEYAGTATPKDRARWWLDLAQLAQNDLYRPNWALSAIEQGLAAPTSYELLLRNHRLAALLASGQNAEVLAQAAVLWKHKEWLDWNILTCAHAWLAADGNLRLFWAQRLLADYRQKYNTALIDWRFSGLRHAFLSRPDSPARAQALRLILLLEQAKSAETSAKLAALLGLPNPGPNSNPNPNSKSVKR